MSVYPSLNETIIRNLSILISFKFLKIKITQADAPPNTLQFE
jgi:type IV secretory pathway component VirB8